MEITTHKSFAMAVKEFFGKGEQSLQQFQQELKALTDKDRQDIANGMAKLGHVIENMPATGDY